MTPSKVIREEGKSCGSHPRSNSNLKNLKYVDSAVQTDQSIFKMLGKRTSDTIPRS
jgi:hypothetical protein